MEIRGQLAIVRAWFPQIAGIAVVAALVTFLVTSAQPRVYDATAQLIVGQSLTVANPTYTQLLASQQLSTTYATVATTGPILDATIKELSLPLTADDLRKRVLVTTTLGSTLLTITASDSDPTEAAAIANALAKQLVAASPTVQGQHTELQASIAEELKATQDQIASNKTQIAALLALPTLTADQTTRLATLESDSATLGATYTTLLAYAAGGSNLLTVVDPATAPTTPVAPKPLQFTLLAVVAGLLGGAALAFIKEFLDDRIRSADDVQALLGLPALGRIGRLRDRSGGGAALLVGAQDPWAPESEAYRSLRTNIEFAAVDAPIRSLLVTSAGAGEGKSVTAANLAIVFAQADRRVLLVDADLRKPDLHRLLGLPNEEGLTTLFWDETLPVDRVALATQQPNLRLLSSGPLPPNPTEVLSSARMGHLFDRIAAEADIVVVDGPPLGVAADAALLSTKVDGVVLVLDVRRSRGRAVRGGRDELARAGATILGAVLNRAPAGQGSGFARRQAQPGGSPGVLRRPTDAVPPSASSRS